MHTARIARSFSVTFCLCAALAAAAAARTLSLSEYAQELDRLSIMAGEASANPAAAEAAREELRGGWKVESGGQAFDVDTGWMLDCFDRLKASPDNRIRDQLLERIRALRADALAFVQPPPDSARARATLERILARREFHEVHGPSWLDRLKFRMELWIFRLLSRLFGSSSVPVINRVVVWILVAIAVLVLASFIYRAINKSAGLESIMLETPPAAAKKWRLWMEEAEEAAGRGLWREAIHLAYWAAISFLEESGTWRPDQARTPREYLRLLPAGSDERRALVTLTRQLERTWYGSERAGPDGFAAALADLEKLGCRRA